MPGDRPAAVEICNRALGLIEHNVRFADFTDGTQEAEEAALHYDEARRFVLAKVRWHFAKSYIELAAKQAGEKAPAKTPNVYQLPPEVIAVRALPDDRTARWHVGHAENKLYTDCGPPLLIEATIDVEDASRFEPDFVAALELYLASRFASRFSRSQNRAQILSKRFDEAIREAAENDAQEGGDEPWDGRLEPDWRTAVVIPGQDPWPYGRY